MVIQVSALTLILYIYIFNEFSDVHLMWSLYRKEISWKKDGGRSDLHFLISEAMNLLKMLLELELFIIIVKEGNVSEINLNF